MFHVCMRDGQNVSSSSVPLCLQSHQRLNRQPVSDWTSKFRGMHHKCRKLVKMPPLYREQHTGLPCGVREQCEMAKRSWYTSTTAPLDSCILTYIWVSEAWVSIANNTDCGCIISRMANNKSPFPIPILIWPMVICLYHNRRMDASPRTGHADPWHVIR